jgi:phosphatidylglycerophosphatase A
MAIRNFIVKIISSFFYIGYLPLIPGTFGSLAGVLLFYLVKDNPAGYTLLTCIFIILGFLVAGGAEKIANKKDASCIVIDEVAGMFLSLLFLPFYDMKVFILAFFMFRLLDTLKPFPAERFQDLKGSVGVMSDDLVAGLYTNIILQAALRLASCKTS